MADHDFDARQAGIDELLLNPDHLLDTISDSIITTDLEFHILTWNKAAEVMYGWAAGEVIGQRLPDVIDSEIPDGSHDETVALLARDGEWQHDGVQTRRDGRYLNTHGTMRLILNNDDVPIGIMMVYREITVHKQHDEDRAWLNAILQSSAHAIIGTTLDGIVQFWNPAAEHTYGYAADEIVGRSIKLLLPPDKIQERHEVFDHIAHGHAVEIPETIRRRKDGKLIYISISITPIVDTDGNIIGSTSTSQDITKRREIEQQIHYQANLLEYVSDAIISTDTEFKIVSWNKAAEVIYGWPADEVIGRLIVDVMASDYSPLERGQVMAMYRERGFWRGEIKQYRRDGTPLYMLSSIVMLRDQSGQHIGSLNVNHNITDRVQNEQRLKFQASLLENVSDAIISANVDYEIVTWNRAAEQMYGWRADEVLGRTTYDILRSDHGGVSRPQLHEQFLEVGHWQGEVRHLHQDGTTLDVLSSLTMLRDAQGNNIGAVAVNRDITKIKQADKIALEAIVQAEKVHVLGEFIQAASHDFRMPLSVIISRLFLLKNVNNPAKFDHHLNVIGHEARRMSKIIDDLSVLVHLDITPDISPMQVDLNQLVASLEVKVPHLIANKKLKVSFEMSNELITVPIDQLYMYRALLRVLENAVQYTPDGGSITARTALNDHHAVIEIEDTGIGISADDLPRIFDRFYRVDEARSQTGSAGLGLSIVKKIIEQHDADIEVISEVDVGTIVRILLPLE